MVIHTIEDFLRFWLTEAPKTIKLLSAIQDDSQLSIKYLPNFGTMGELIWHMLESPKDMLARAGLTVDGPKVFSKPPKSVVALLDEHGKLVESVARQIHKNWKDADLDKTDDIYGEQWLRSDMLLAIITHLIHHRGQLTVLMNMAGIEVPGIYGPIKEDWHTEK